MTLRFAFGFLDVLVQDFWDETLATYAEIYDDVVVTDGHLQGQLDRLEIKPTANTQKYIADMTTEQFQ